MRISLCCGVPVYVYQAFVSRLSFPFNVLHGWTVSYYSGVGFLLFFVFFPPYVACFVVYSGINGSITTTSLAFLHFLGYYRR